MFVTAKAQDFLTYSRSSIGTYVGSDGLIKTAAVDKARIEYGSDGSVKGLLIEEERTNLVLYTRPQAVHWSTTYASVAENVGTAPDGTASASRITVSSATNFHFAAPVTVPAMGASPHTVSCFLKADTVNTASLFLTQVNNNGAVFSLTGSGSVSNVSGTGNTAEISEVGNGWYRCSVTNDGGADLVDQLRIGVANGALGSYAGNGTDSILAWGFQLEQGSFATSYIPTSGSTVTRSPDIASIPITAFGYNQDAGTVVVKASTFLDGGLQSTLVNISDQTSSGGAERMQLRFNNNNFQSIFSTNGVAQGNKTVSATIDANTFYRAAWSFDGPNTLVTAGAGSVSSPDTSHDVPGPVVEVRLGHLGQNISLQSTETLNGHIKSLKYYPRKLAGHEISLESYSGTINTTYYVTNSGSGAYTFTGGATGNNPTLDVVRGNTYAFSVNASGHPFYLTTDDGTNFSAGNYVSEYTTGVTNSRSQDNTLFWTVDASAPNTLYYQCGNHAAMKGTINITG